MFLPCCSQIQLGQEYGWQEHEFDIRGRKPEGHRPDSPAVQALGRRMAFKDTKAQRAVTPGHSPLGLGRKPSLCLIPGLAPLGFRVPAFQANEMRFPQFCDEPLRSFLPHGPASSRSPCLP